MFNIPEYSTVKLTDAERFAIGLRELFKECHVREWSAFQTIFKDGTCVGNKVLAQYALSHIDSIR